MKVILQILRPINTCILCYTSQETGRILPSHLCRIQMVFAWLRWFQNDSLGLQK